MVDLPLGAVFVVSLGSPLLAFVGVLVAQRFRRKDAQELETRSRREEALRTLRWAAELSASAGGRLAALGVTQLRALLSPDLQEETEKSFVAAALGAVYESSAGRTEQLGEEAVVVETPSGPRSIRDGPAPPTGGASSEPTLEGTCARWPSG